MDSSTWSDAQSLAYIASYADLRKAIGANAAAGRAHFASAGAAEGRSIAFDALAYVASYSDLARAFGTDSAAAARHFIQTGAAEGRKVTFDPLVYIASYADLRSALGIDSAAGARHFILAGANEGRKASFDPLAYIASYPDLRNALGADSAAGARHFILAGAAEGRTTSFDALAYIASYGDLVRAIGMNSAAGARHFIETGAAEGRTASFDALAYIASYGDLTRALGTNAAAGTRHFIETGSAEGRTTSFDGLAYIASYGDLMRALGTDRAAGTRHFIDAGAAEGRMISFDPVNYLFSNSDLLVAGITATKAARHWIVTGFNEGRSASSAFGTEQGGHALALSTGVTGAIDSAGDRDWFRVDLAAGQGVSFDFFPSNGNGVVALHDDTGRVIAPSERVGPRTSFVAPKAGLFYLTVSTANAATGTYTLTANDFLGITGGSGADALAGTNGADAIRGLEGGDTITGRGGNDLLEGGEGFDQLNGGPGNDTLYGNNAANTGFDFSDALTDDQGGNDQLFGQEGNDSIFVSRSTFPGSIPASTVLIDGGNGDDSINFGGSRAIDTVTVRGGAGDDRISVNSVLKSTIDAGDGNDRVNIGMSGGDQTIALGAGSDVLTLDSIGGVFAVGNPTYIVDFQIGADTLNIDPYLAAVLLGWDKATNPFVSGHLRLVQSGSDALLQLDRDGRTGTGYGFATLLTFGNTATTGLTAREIGYTPDGTAATGQTITGTSAVDALIGTDGPDIIRGLAGGDVLTGRSGNDLLEGGEGFDQLNGSFGNDTLYGNNAANAGFDAADLLSDDQGGDDKLFGQEGNDSISVSRYAFNGDIPASTVLLDGGNGDDALDFGSSRFVDTVTLRGGAGNDRINVGSVLTSVVEAGDGNDRITIGTQGGNQTITLGGGSDVLILNPGFNSFAIGNPIRIVDFQTSTDRLDIDQYLSSVLLGWDTTVNPFATGHLLLIQSGSDSLLQIDRDGGIGTDHALSTLLTLANTTAVVLSAQDFGFAPDGSAPVGQMITGTNDGDALAGTNAADAMRGFAGGDTLGGRGGNDLLEGGEGQDQLDGGLGNDTLYGNNAANTGSDGADNLSDNLGGDDQLFGQDGNDSIFVSRFGLTPVAASTLLLDGGNGDDQLFFSSSRLVDTVTMRGGAGNDTLNLGSVLTGVIEAGDGNDRVTIARSANGLTVTLGTGSDVLTVDSLIGVFDVGAPTRIVDFQVGADTLGIDQYLASALSGWDRTTNPFVTGHLKLFQSGSDTLLQVDRDGSVGTSYSPATLLVLANTTATAFTAQEIGYLPIGPFI